MRAVGVGGFARVYHAVDPDLELDVAVKVLRPELAYDPEVVERFRREASTAAKLRHPHVITVLTVGRLAEPFDGIPAGAPYLVMDYLPHSLADRIGEGGALPEAEVARVGAEVARGLAYAHRQGIVHRDVKPENVLFARDGRAVVTDFGIARALSTTPSGPSRQVLLGTPTYFSPEQARGLPLDGRSDLYALGVTLYRGATGTVPFGGEDWYVVMRQHVEEVAPAPSTINREIGPGFDAVLARTLAKNPADRYPTGDALAEALDGLRGAARKSLNTTEIPHVAAAPAPGHRARRLRWAAAALAAVSVAVVGGRVLAVHGSPERLPTGADPRAPGARTEASGKRPPVDAGVGGSTGGRGTALAAGGRAPNDSAARARPDSSTVGAAGATARAASPPSPRAPDSATALTARHENGVRLAGAGATATRGRPPAHAAGASTMTGTAGAGHGTTLGGLTVSAPADADVYVDGDLVSRGPWRSPPVRVGHYNVRASLGGLPGCSSADTTVAVDVTPNARRTIVLEPVPCGRLVLDFSATTAAHYTLIPLRGGPTHEGTLPLAQPLILPDGLYRLTVQASACAPYTDDRLPVVAGNTRREPHHTLICQ